MIVEFGERDVKDNVQMVAKMVELMVYYNTLIMGTKLD
jgi:hypothetical protein